MTVQVERDGAVTTIIHHRPAARNAMDPASADALHDAFLAFEADDDAHVAVLWGKGGAFCAGWDLSYADSLKDLDDPVGELRFPADGGVTPRGPLGPTRLALGKPTIAAVAGPAVAGGMELALWCDLRVMERNAYFGVYCRRWGIPLLNGGTVRLPRLVGQGRALDIILTGRKVAGRGVRRDRPLRALRRARPVPRGGRGLGARNRPLPASLHARRSTLGDRANRPSGARRAGTGIRRRPRRRQPIRRRCRPARGFFRILNQTAMSLTRRGV